MPKWVGALAWAWLIVIGALLITPLGPVCIACGVPATQLDYILGGISIVLGLGGLATQMGAARTA